MGLRRIAAAGLVLLALGAGGACSSDDPDRAHEAGTSTTGVESTAPTERGDLLGGSRYLVVNDRDERGLPRLVLRDLVADAEEVVDEASSRTYTHTTVDADGAVAWAEWDDGSDEAVLIRPADGPAVQVDDRSATCPRWLPDGRLLVTVGDDEAKEVAAVDPTTGATDEVFAVDLGAVPQCPSPAGPGRVVLARPIGDEPYGPGGARVVRTGLDGTGEEVLGTVPGGCWPLDVAASVDGDRAAAGVICEDARLTGLYIGTLDDELRLVFGRNEDADPTHAEVEVHPAWSGDGTLVAFDRADQTSGRAESTLWTVTWPGGEAAPLEEDPSALAALSPPEDGGGRD